MAIAWCDTNSNAEVVSQSMPLPVTVTLGPFTPVIGRSVMMPYRAHGAAACNRCALPPGQPSMLPITLGGTP